jgi:hypothetical protein
MRATEALAEYGYTLDQDGQGIRRPDGVHTGTKVVRVKNGRVQVRIVGLSGGLLWSGPENALGIFCAQFWFAEKLS